MQILDGKLASKAIKEELAHKISVLKSQEKKIPHLAAILVGNNAGSETYVASKVKNCNEIGIRHVLQAHVLGLDAVLLERARHHEMRDGVLDEAVDPNGRHQ